MNIPMIRTCPNPAPAPNIAPTSCGSKKSPNPIDIHVGARVRLRRMMLGMSQEKLGEHLGITFQQIQKYEKGTNRIGANQIIPYAPGRPAWAARCRHWCSGATRCEE